MSQKTARRAPAPAELRPSHQSIEEPLIQTLENVLEIMQVALRPRDKLPSANLTDQLRLTPDVSPVQIQAVTVRIPSGYRLAIEFAEQYVGQRLGYGRGRAFQEIRNADVQAAVFQSNKAVRIR